ncbi:hypothetical protein PTW35_11765 [Photobacterium sp. DA100]|uniref:hypothetical protein n=1 Tax=Photobacterium sp. DA100 TaxID=3027472 RepID=UPI0024784E86|nr:hypothetical protein [Photobacterium sp. DA100]WEM41307.1 hypothetical protein PTW35_11765 [Photobacterium sp. DA100]
MIKLPSETLEVLQGVASLKAIYNDKAQPGTEVFMYDGTPEQWTNTYSEIQVIYADRLVSVTEKSNKPGRGLFTIGKHRNWYYSHSLFATPEELENKIYELLRFSLTGKTSLTQKRKQEDTTSA